MNSTNPYSPPKAPVSDVSGSPTDTIERLNRIASSQRLVVISIVSFVGARVFTSTIGPAGVLLLIAALIMSIVGVIRLSGALGHSNWVRVGIVIGLFIPIINIVIMAILSSRATRRLRAAGYRVGLLGASGRGA